MGDNWVEVEVFVIVDDQGDAIASASEEGDAWEVYYDTIGATDRATRCVTLKLKVEKPRAVELRAEVPLTGNGAKLVSVQ